MPSKFCPATDQYSLAVMVYQLVTGHRPFEADTPYALMHKHLNEPPTPPQTYRSDVPEAVTRVLGRGLSKDPAERFPTVTAFAQAFSNAVADWNIGFRCVRDFQPGDVAATG